MHIILTCGSNDLAGKNQQNGVLLGEMMQTIELLRRLSADLMAHAARHTHNVTTDKTEIEVATHSGLAQGYLSSARLLESEAVKLNDEYLANKAEHEHARNCAASDSLPY